VCIECIVELFLTELNTNMSTTCIAQQRNMAYVVILPTSYNSSVLHKNMTH
jgi:hypothetical protein